MKSNIYRGGRPTGKDNLPVKSKVSPISASATDEIPTDGKATPSSKTEIDYVEKINNIMDEIMEVSDKYRDYISEISIKWKEEK